MGARPDVVVIGAGHNGLVAAALLAKDGRRVTVLERAAEVGGILRGGEFAPGFTAPGLAHTVGRLRRSVIEELRLEDHGLSLMAPPVRMFAPQPDGSSVTFWGDPARTARELRERNPRDADSYVEFDRKVRAVASFLAHRVTRRQGEDLPPPSGHVLLLGTGATGMPLLEDFVLRK